MNTTSSLLSMLIWVPILGGVLVLIAGSRRRSQARWLALLASLATFFLSIALYLNFDTGSAAMQFQELHPWIEVFKINYHLGVDGFAVPLILLTTLFGVLVVIAGWEVIQTKVHQYMASFLIMEGLMVGVFCALDAMLFYVFFEAMLIPMFLVIGMWGGPNRVYATIKFFLYTFLGSVFMLIGLIYLYIHSGSWDIQSWQAMPLDMPPQDHRRRHRGSRGVPFQPRGGAHPRAGQRDRRLRRRSSPILQLAAANRRSKRSLSWHTSRSAPCATSPPT